MNYAGTTIEVVCSHCPRRKEGQRCERCAKREMYEEAMQMQEILEQEPTDSPEEMVFRLGLNNQYIARSGYLMAEAKKFHDEQSAVVFDDCIGKIEKLPATIANKFLMSQLADIAGIFTLLERQNRAFVHQSENLRTQVSFVKQELEMQRKGY